MAARLVPDMPLMVYRRHPGGGPVRPEAIAQGSAQAAATGLLAPALPPLMPALQLIIRSCPRIA